jgi:hypothetical protein
MEFKNIVENSTKVFGMANDQLNKWMTDFKKGTDILETLGFKIDKFTVSMAVLPEVHTTLSGKIERIQKDRVEKLMQDYKDHSLTVTLLKGLLLAKRVSDHLEGKLESAILHITLGISPKVDVELH